MSEEIIGLTVVLAALDSVLSEVSAKADAAIQAAGIECQSEAKQNAPVLTGQLRDSIEYRAGTLECTVSAGNDEVDYAQFQEFGTVHMPAHPFLLPAFELASQHLMVELEGLL